MIDSRSVVGAVFQIYCPLKELVKEPKERDPPLRVASIVTTDRSLIGRLCCHCWAWQ